MSTLTRGGYREAYFVLAHAAKMGRIPTSMILHTHLGELLADLGARQWPFFSGEEVEVEGDYKAMLDAGRKIVWLDGKLWERVT